MILINRCFEVDLNKGLVKDLNTNHVTSIGINEIELLKYFLSHPNELLSKKQLIDNIWTKRGVVVEESSLMNALSSSRKAFGDKNGEVIKTERGKGYRFVGIVDVYATQPQEKQNSKSKEESENDNVSYNSQTNDKRSLIPVDIDVSSLFSRKWVVVYIVSATACFFLGYYGSVISKGFFGPKNAEGYSYRIYDSCIYKTKKGDVKVDLGSARVISSGGISIAINDKLESVSFPSDIVGRFCE